MNPKYVSILLLILLGIMFFLLIGIVNYWSVMSHEDAHVAINKYFGASSYYTINLDWQGIHGLTRVDANAQFYSEEDRRAAYMIHGINEAVGYQLTPFFNGIMLFFMILIIMILFNNTTGDDNNGEGNSRRITIYREDGNSKRVE